MSAWWPPGHGLGYDHTFTNEVADFVRAIVEGTDPEPSLLEGYRSNVSLQRSNRVRRAAERGPSSMALSVSQARGAE